MWISAVIYTFFLEKQTESLNLLKIRKVKDFGAKTDILGHNPVKIGQKVKVYVDGVDKPFAGTVNWIAQKAEFTPKTIQTKDERANLVYAVKIDVPNDGTIKIGMYGDVVFE